MVVCSLGDLVGGFRGGRCEGGIWGGRFVGGLSRGAFALPGALEALRALKKRPGAATQQDIKISAADPLNLSLIHISEPTRPY